MVKANFISLFGPSYSVAKLLTKNGTLNIYGIFMLVRSNFISELVLHIEWDKFIDLYDKDGEGGKSSCVS